MRIEDLSVNERILIHLKDYSPDPESDGAAMGQTQEGIGEGVGIRVNHVPRATKTLLEDGYIGEALVHVGGLKRKRKAFFLTARGAEIAADLTANLKGQKILFRSDSGTESSIALKDILFKARGSSASRLILSYFREGVILEANLLGTSAARFISNLDTVPEPDTFTDRKAESEFLKNKIQNGEKLIVVSGIKGIGKTSLVRTVLSQYEDRKNIFWYSLHDWDSARSILEQMSENHVRLGRNELKKMLRQTRDTDIGLSAQTFLKDIQDSESITVLDNIFDLKKEAMQLLFMLCGQSKKMGNACLLLITRDRQSLSPAEFLGHMCQNDLVLKGLEHDSAAELLGKMGMNPADIERVYAMTQGHPLAMKLVNSDEIKNLIDTKGLTEEEIWVVRCLKAFDAIFE